MEGGRRKVDKGRRTPQRKAHFKAWRDFTGVGPQLPIDGTPLPNRKVLSTIIYPGNKHSDKARQREGGPTLPPDH